MKNKILRIESVTQEESIVLSLIAMLMLVLGFDVAWGVNIGDYSLTAGLGLTLILWLFCRSRFKRATADYELHSSNEDIEPSQAGSSN